MLANREGLPGNLPGLRYKVCISGAISLGYSVVSILFTCLGCVNEDRFFFNLRPGDSDWIASNALDCVRPLILFLRRLWPT
ncbi:hypothetical protein OPV22_005292 [Ensete ventricosum]|uniref:CASP-like protein n=1 Tax=Ensete ventricosum TaxID=4639 RepID=A0AAV8RP77_ENSVE|nr:hypothetical protein OPV22_005292 [Ensete ventricosum]